MVRRDSLSSLDSEDSFYSPPSSPFSKSSVSPFGSSNSSNSEADHLILPGGIVLEPFVASSIRPFQHQQPSAPQQRAARTVASTTTSSVSSQQRPQRLQHQTSAHAKKQDDDWHTVPAKRTDRSSTSGIDREPHVAYGAVFRPKPQLVACHSFPQTDHHDDRISPTTEQRHLQQLSPKQHARRRKEAEFRSMINKAIHFCRTSVIPTLLRAKENPGSVALKGCCARMTELGRDVAAMPAPARRAVVREVKDELMDAYYIAFRELKMFINARGIATFIHFLTRLGLRICEWCEFPYFIEQWYAVTAANFHDLNRQGISLIFGALVAQGHNAPRAFLDSLLSLTDRLLLSISLTDALDLLEMSEESQLTRHLSMIFRGYAMLTDFMQTPERTAKFLALIDIALERFCEQELCGIVQGAMTLHMLGYELQQQFLDRLMRQTTIVEILTNKGKRMRYTAYRYFGCHPYRAQRLLKEIRKSERPDDCYISESESTVVHLLKYMARDYHYHVEPCLFIDAIASRVDAVLTLKKGRPVVVQFDGPHHFYHPNNVACRKDLLQNRMLEKEGYTVLRIPYYEVYYHTNNGVMENLRKHLEQDLGLKKTKEKKKKKNKKTGSVEAEPDSAEEAGDEEDKYSSSVED